MDPSLQGRMPNVPYSSPNRGRRFRISPRTLMLGVGGLAVIIIGLVLLNLSGDKTGQLQQHLVARLATLQKMTDEGSKHIKDGDLRNYNSRLQTQIISDQKSISDILTNKKTDKVITANEADTASLDALKDAQLNSRFDDAYRTLIAQKLDSTTQLMREIYGKTQSKALKTALDSAYRDFKQLESQLKPTTSS